MPLPFTPKPGDAYQALHPPTFDAIVRAHSREVVDLARLFGAPEREAEDVAQEVFMALDRAIREGRFRFDMPPGPWLWRTTYLITKDHLRALRRCGYPIDPKGELEPMDGQADAERTVQVSQQYELLLELLDDLDDDLRAVFVLHEVKELSLPV